MSCTSNPNINQLHCWHHTGGNNHSNLSGQEDYKCCFCGVTVRKLWDSISHPDHGQYFNIRMKHYEPNTSEMLKLYGNLP